MTVGDLKRAIANQPDGAELEMAIDMFYESVKGKAQLQRRFHEVHCLEIWPDSDKGPRVLLVWAQDVERSRLEAEEQ